MSERYKVVIVRESGQTEEYSDADRMWYPDGSRALAWTNGYLTASLDHRLPLTLHQLTESGDWELYYEVCRPHGSNPHADNVKRF